MSIINVKVSGVNHTYELLAYDAEKKQIKFLEPRLNVSNNGNTWGFGGHNVILADGKFVKYIKKMFENEVLVVDFGIDDVISMDDVLSMSKITYLGVQK